MFDTSIIELIRRDAVPLHDTDSYSKVIDLVGDAQLVLLGEATHGTHEFYRARLEITKQLLLKKGFYAIAVESDWPDALRLSRYLAGRGQDHTPEEALGDFERFPRWMWRNTDIVALAQWLHDYNATLPELKDKISFFGLDLYSLHRSMEAVVQYLSDVDPDAARRARERYSCFDHLAQDPQQYGYATVFGDRKDCENEVMRQLVRMSVNLKRYAQVDGTSGFDEAFYAEQNARVAQNAEAYYRTMFLGRNESWNLRDTHMADTLDALLHYLAKRHNILPKIVAWAHNSHIGDARATEMGEHGQINLGQLVRERYGEHNTFLLGFTTHSGTVTAASDWDSPAKMKNVLPARDDSFEHLLHESKLEKFLLPIRGHAELAQHLHDRRLERAIGVVYLPESERLSHYFYTDFGSQFDAVIHFDKTRAVKPLDTSSQYVEEEIPETYPTGI
jgi:erythromycin esterase-like protein